ncbi:hypothetical protein QYE76_008772 [Lolium multiflorum]|uniref:AP180 N-terminal homology (ANTH) domain-containing protein n=1 Tax=Lolium multiflorum TaxID=4521 RepID=A0AAD8X187_LOLMU|nr:hypothetical protein QYE76_008772 [Lolium multiflorum]
MLLARARIGGASKGPFPDHRTNQESITYIMAELNKLHPEEESFADDNAYNRGGAAAGSSPAPDMTVSVNDMDAEALLACMGQLRNLIDHFLVCCPMGAARHSRVVLAMLCPIVEESVRLYDDFAVVLSVRLDRFFDMDYAEAYVSAARVVNNLLAFYSWCDDTGATRSVDFPLVKPIDDKFLETLEQFVRDRGKALQSEASPLPPHALQELCRAKMT